MHIVVTVEELEDLGTTQGGSVSGLLVVWGANGGIHAALLPTSTTQDQVFNGIIALPPPESVRIANAQAMLGGMEQSVCCLIVGGPIAFCHLAVVRGGIAREGRQALMVVESGTVFDHNERRLWDFEV